MHHQTFLRLQSVVFQRCSIVMENTVSRKLHDDCPFKKLLSSIPSSFFFKQKKLTIYALLILLVCWPLRLIPSFCPMSLLTLAKKSVFNRSLFFFFFFLPLLFLFFSFLSHNTSITYFCLLLWFMT